MSLIALEFDDSRLLITTAHYASEKMHVSDLHEMEIGGKTDDEVGEALKSYLQANNAGKSDAIAIVNRTSTEIRELVVPPAPDDELPEMIRFQSRKEFASLSDDWALDYIPLAGNANNSADETSGSGPHRVLAAALGPDISSRIKAICKVANVKLKRILLRPFAAADLLDDIDADGKLRLVVDQNLETVDLTVLRDRKLLATRTVRMPSELSNDQRARQLISEVRRTLVFAKAATDGQKISDVIISGEEARNRQLAGDLSGPLAMQVQFINPFEGIGLKGGDEKKIAEHASRHMAAVGGLKKELRGGRPAIDFLNPRRKIVKKVDYRKYWIYSALAAGIAIVGLFFAWWNLSQQTRDIEEMQAKLAQAIAVNDGDETTPSVEQRLAEIGKIDQWKMEEVNWLVELSEFSKRYLLPDDVIADSFSAALRKDAPATIDLSGRIVDDLAKTEELLASLGARPYSVEPIDTGVDSDDRDSKLTSTFEYQIKLLPSHSPEATDDADSNANPMLSLDREALNFLKAQKAATAD